MQILFIHGNYPAQFEWLAAALGGQSGHEVRFLTARADAAQHPIAGVALEPYSELAPVSASPLHQATDAAISRATVIEARLWELAQQGFVPRLVVVHGGNGLGLLIKQLIPNCVVIGYFEWYFHPNSAALLTGQSSRSARQLVQLRNLSIAAELLQCDRAVVPTPWQASQFPAELRSKLTVIFDGIDTTLLKPPASAARNWPLQLQGESGAVTLAADQPLLSYATRGMEPLRGFPQFMRALPQVLAARPELQVLVGGRDRSAYGAVAPSHGGSWKQRLLAELGDFPGRERLHFTGLLNRGAYVALLQRTNLHCYFSEGYVPSWSLFEAVACGAPLLTNHNPATTGTLPQLDHGAVDLAAPAEQLAAVMLARLEQHAEAPAPGLPPELERSHCQRQWQALINGALQGAHQA